MQWIPHINLLAQQSRLIYLEFAILLLDSHVSLSTFGITHSY
ncbi:hypothetical protein [Aulosira sp. FACHB-615]|nr:hypothetical protein [Aulosira sp. FACHB-615]